jgi:hypothetical protein
LQHPREVSNGHGYLLKKIIIQESLEVILLLFMIIRCTSSEDRKISVKTAI